MCIVLKFLHDSAKIHVHVQHLLDFWCVKPLFPRFLHTMYPNLGLHEHLEPRICQRLLGRLRHLPALVLPYLHPRLRLPKIFSSQKYLRASTDM